MLAMPQRNSVVRAGRLLCSSRRFTFAGDFERPSQNHGEHIIRQVPQILRVCVDALSTGLAAGSRDAISTQGYRNAFVDVRTPDVTL
jgi:hypothetical protein